MFAAVHTSSSGPSVDVRGWLAWIIILGGVAVALLAIRQLVKQVLIPVGRAARHVVAGMDVLFEIAAEFRPDSGSTLHDRITEIDGTTKSTNRNLGELWDYAHKSHHDLVNALVQIGPGVAIITALAKKLGVVPEPMPEDPK